MTNEGIGQLATAGVSGVLTPEQALDQMLKNTGVHWRFTGTNSVVLELNSVTESIDVSASTSALPTSISKYSEPIRDTPQTVNVVGQQVMAEQNTTTLRDALRNVAGISIAAGEGGAQGDNLTIRGFSARNDLYIDGMRDFGSYYRDPFNLEEVDVVQGPSAATFGRGSTGGVVNQATKMPNLLRAFSGTFDGGTDGTRRATADVNVPLAALGKGAAFRMNVMGTEGGVAGRDVAFNRRYGVAPSLSFGHGNRHPRDPQLSQSAGGRYPDYGIPWLFNQPAPVARNNYYGFREGNYLRTKDNIATLRAEHDFNSHVSIRNQTRYARYLRDVQITEPQILGTVTLATPLSAIVINRNQLASNSVEALLANQTDVTIKFQTGAVKHTAVVGMELDREDSDPTRPRYTGVPTTSLLAPDDTQKFAGVATINTIVHARSNSAVRLCDRYRQTRLALGIERLLPLRPFQLALHAGRRRRPPPSTGWITCRPGAAPWSTSPSRRSASMRRPVIRSTLRPNPSRSAPAPPAFRRKRIAPTKSAPNGTSRAPASRCAPPCSKPTS